MTRKRSVVHPTDTMALLLVLVMSGAMFQLAMSVTCYDCISDEEPDCNETTNGTNLQTCTAPQCSIFVGVVNGLPTVARKCNHEQFGDGCISINDTSHGVTQEGRLCLCSNDFCSSKLTEPVDIITTPSAVTTESSLSTVHPSVSNQSDSNVTRVTTQPPVFNDSESNVTNVTRAVNVTTQRPPVFNDPNPNVTRAVGPTVTTPPVFNRSDSSVTSASNQTTTLISSYSTDGNQHHQPGNTTSAVAASLSFRLPSHGFPSAYVSRLTVELPVIIFLLSDGIV